MQRAAQRLSLQLESCDFGRESQLAELHSSRPRDDIPVRVATAGPRPAFVRGRFKCGRGGYVCVLRPHVLLSSSCTSLPSGAPCRASKRSHKDSLRTHITCDRCRLRKRHGWDAGHSTRTTDARERRVVRLLCHVALTREQSKCPQRAQTSQGSCNLAIRTHAGGARGAACGGPVGRRPARPDERQVHTPPYACRRPAGGRASGLSAVLTHPPHTHTPGRIASP